MKKIYVLFIFLLVLCSCMSYDVNLTIEYVNTDFNSNYLYRIESTDGYNYINNSGDVILEFEKDEDLPKLILKENGFLHYKGKNYQYVNEKLIEIDKRYYPIIFDDTIYFYKGELYEYFDLNFKPIKHLFGHTISDFCTGVLSLSADKKTSCVVGVNGKRLIDDIKNDVGNLPELYRVNIYYRPVTFNNVSTDFVFVKRNNKLYVLNEKLEKICKVDNVLDIYQISFESKDNNASAINITANNSKYRYDLSSHKLSKVEDFYDYSFSNGSYYNRNSAYIKDIGSIEDIDAWVIRGNHYIKYLSDSNKVIILELASSGDILRTVEFNEDGNYTVDLITKEIVKNSNHQYTIDNVVYTSKNTIIYDFDDNFILHDKENKKLISSYYGKLEMKDYESTLSYFSRGLYTYLLLENKLFSYNRSIHELSSFNLDNNYVISKAFDDIVFLSYNYHTIGIKNNKIILEFDGNISF